MYKIIQIDNYWYVVEILLHNGAILWISEPEETLKDAEWSLQVVSDENPIDHSDYECQRKTA